MTTKIDTKLFRNALSQFATGVTVVTCRADGAPLGMTANSFSSVSLDPPLVLWSVMKSASRFAPFAAAQDFSIHILAQDQGHVCQGFAKDGQYFDHVDWAYDARQVPILSDCLCRFDCTQDAIHDAGDHAIIIGTVTHFDMGSGEPMIFAQGRLGGITPPMR